MLFFSMEHRSKKSDKSSFARIVAIDIENGELQKVEYAVKKNFSTAVQKYHFYYWCCTSKCTIYSNMQFKSIKQLQILTYANTVVTL